MADDQRNLSMEPASDGNPLIQSARDQVAAARLRRQSLVAAGHVPDSSEASILARQSLPNYELQRELHRGGQGVVYLALQESTGRQVAVKVFRRQTVGGVAELTRFEREVDVLTRLKHPNIVTIHDCARSEEDVFLVMDYIAGRPLDAYMALEELDLREAVDLFARICDGVNAAHLRGVIHRDIKPSNIRIDEQGEPRILDFGLAKIADEVNAAGAGMTITGQFIGSIPWASPEQALGRTDTLDVRTDVYSLGVMFFQLLTGEFPYPVGGPMNEAIRHIVSTDPARPSALDRAIVNEVETILLKCLAKEPERRYQNAGELGRDFRHFLAGEPIEAKRDSVRYVLRKQLRRHRGAVAAAALITIVLISASAISIRFAWKEAQARRLAETRADETKQVASFQANMLSGLDAAAVGQGIVSQMREARRAALKRQPVGEWPNRRPRTDTEVEVELSKLEAAIGPIPAADVARRVLDEFLLGQASKTVERSFPEQPLVEARIRDSLCSAYSALGLKPQAEEQCRMALAIRRKELPLLDADTANTLTLLAFILSESGRYAEAESLSREVLEIRLRIYDEMHVDVAWAYQNLAAGLRRQGKLSEAERHYRHALAIRRELFGDEHLDTAGSMNSLALLFQNKGDYAQAEPLFRESLAIRRKLLGDRNTVIAGSLNNLAYLVARRGNRAEAETLFREALALRRDLLGSEHAEVAQSLHNLGLFLIEDSRYADAEPLLREAVEIWRRTLPPGHPDLGKGVQGLANVVKAQQRYADAEPLFREALNIARDSYPQSDPGIANAMLGWASVLCDRGDFEHCESIHREIMLQYESRMPPEQRPAVRQSLAATLIKRTVALADAEDAGASRLDEAESLLLAVAEEYSTSKSATPSPVMVQECFGSLVQLYELRHAAHPDKGFDMKAAEWRTKLEGIDH